MTPSDKPLAEDILRSLRRITRAIDLHSRRMAADFGLTIPQLLCLRALADTEGLSATTLARSMDLTLATLTGIFDRLVRRDLAHRARCDKDRRRVILTITPQGRGLLAKAPPPLQQRFIERLARLSGPQQAAIDEALRSVVAMMDAQELDASPLLTSGPQAASATAVEEFLAPKA